MRRVYLAIALGCVGIIVVTPESCMAQSAFERGETAGYNDQAPPNGAPDMTTEYGRGWRQGQDEADDEDDALSRSRAHEKEMSREQTKAFETVPKVDLSDPEPDPAP